MDWRVVRFSSIDAATGRIGLLQEAFADRFMASGGPSDAAMFSAAPTEECFDCYFSPGAVKIFSARLIQENAEACEGPPSNVGLLVGHADAKSALL